MCCKIVVCATIRSNTVCIFEFSSCKLHTHSQTHLDSIVWWKWQYYAWFNNTVNSLLFFATVFSEDQLTGASPSGHLLSRARKTLHLLHDLYTHNREFLYLLVTSNIILTTVLVYWVRTPHYNIPPPTLLE